MIRPLLFSLALLPVPVGAQVWFPIDTPGQATPQPGGTAGMPASPNLAPPEERLPRHRYDPAYPSRGLEGDGQGVPVVNLSPAMRGQLVDRATIEAVRNPQPVVPLAEKGQWVSGTPYVVDGDSFGLNGLLVRLAGIDAPEVDQLCYRGNIPHRCGVESRAWLAGFIEDKRVDCRIHYPDGAQRAVATCWLNGTDINGTAVRNGHALVWEGAPSPYGGVEEEARAEQAGVWAFDFRHPAQWRTIMDDTRRQHDRAIATGAEAPTKPFPYAPFTERATTPTNIPVYTIPAQ